MIWLTGGAGAVVIRASLGLGAALFTLSGSDDNGEIEVERLSPTDELPHGEAEFGVNITMDSSFRLQALATYVAGAQADVMVAVSKNDAVLPCLDDGNEVVNESGGEFESVSVGKLTQGQNRSFDFDVFL